MKFAYGHAFPDEVTELSIELHFYRNLDDVEAKIQHLTRAWKIAFPEVLQDGRAGYIWSYWTDRRIRAWCENRYQTWWGPSASGKTEDAAILLLLHWLSAPDCTTVHLTSTTGKMLKRRIWGAIVKYYLLYGEGVFPGYLKVAENAIVFSEANLRAGIFGHAVKDGKIEDAVSNIIGIHNTYNAMLVDEMQGTPPAIASAPTNLSVGKEFKFLGMGNPMSRLDLLGEWSEPVAGWDSISTALESWETRRGRCYYFDGLKSPGVAEPKKYPFLLKTVEIEETRKGEGEGSPDWWTMRRGFVPPEGLLPTMISESALVAGHAFDDAAWGTTGPETGMGIDPAYSSKGDRCVCYPFQFGFDTTGKMKIRWLAVRQIQLKMAGDKPMLSFIADEVVRIMGDLSINCDNASMDCTGMQGMIADSVEERMMGKIHRVYFGGSVDNEIQVSALDGRTGKEAYKNRATQLMGHMAQYVKADMIRRLDHEAARELCLRQLSEKVSPQRIEAKDDYKSRLGYSPDISDAALVGMAYLREKKRIIPDGMRAGEQDQAQSVRDKDVDAWPDNWLQA
jgi:hypothetical protein